MVLISFFTPPVSVLIYEQTDHWGTQSKGYAKVVEVISKFKGIKIGGICSYGNETQKPQFTNLGQNVNLNFQIRNFLNWVHDMS